MNKWMVWGENPPFKGNRLPEGTFSAKLLMLRQNFVLEREILVIFTVSKSSRPSKFIVGIVDEINSLLK